MIKVNEEYNQRINRIRNDIHRYEIIKDSYIKYPFQTESNESARGRILEELTDISEIRLPKDLKDLCSELLKFFAKKS